MTSIKPSNSNPFLPSERQKTDESLIVERDKTNESLLKSRETTEKQVDQNVVEERAQADKKTITSRQAADADRDSDRNAENYDPRDERKNSDERLQAERRHADIAIDLERKRVDEAIDKEREMKSALASRVLERERQITDKNLKDERFQTDNEVHSSSGLLESEVSEHQKTKTDLTSRDELLAIVSHDLRNPIGAASMCAGLLLDDPEFAEMNPEVKYWITFIKRNVDASLTLIADLLDVERVSQGKLRVVPADSDIGELVTDTVETFKHAAAAKSVDLNTVPLKMKCDVYCDPNRIRQVLSNLIGNAIKFTPEGGSVHVAIELETETVRFSVTDTGAGIPKEKSEQIFQRFAQIGAKDRTGLGLGLYISKMLVEAHHGKIWVESAPDKGSRFIFTIPRYQN